MTLLKVDKYLELTDGRRPVTLCKKGDVQPYVVLTNMREQVRKATKQLTEVRCVIKGSEAALTATGKYMDLPVTISNAGVGVGQASNIVEELIQLGGKVFILLGATGAIQEDINLGDIVVPTGSVRDEGLSDYYAPKQYPAVADYRIVSSLVRAAAEEGYRSHAGIIRTTEGLYPSQRLEHYVRTYHDLGVLSVEQEVSGLLIMCSTKGCYAGACLMVLGNLVQGQHAWHGDSDTQLEKAWFDQISVILRAMQQLHSEGFPPG